MIRLTVPDLGAEEIKAVTEVLNSGYLVQGKYVEAFEERIANYVGSKFAVAVTNCTSALQLSILALGIKPGDYILVTSYSWISTANVIVQCGAHPIFVDIEQDSFNICIENLRIRIIEFYKQHPKDKHRLKAIIPVHTFGQMTNMPAIMQIASEFGLYVIEDAACALGSSINSRMAGSWGIVGCFSFHPRKAITTGEGGMITTSSPEVYQRLLMLRNHGLQKNKGITDFYLPGFNCRMTEMQAAIGLVQMNKLETIIEERRKKASIYFKLIDQSILQGPKEKYGRHIYQSFVILIPKNISRDKVIVQMKDNDIECTYGTILMPDTKYFKDYYCTHEKSFTIASDVSERALTLPLHTFLKLDEQQFVINNLEKLINS